MREQFDLKYKKVLGAKQDWYNWLPMQKMSNNFRRNAIENPAISVFNGQNPSTRITSSILLQSFLHFLKAKDINSFHRYHQKQSRVGSKENKCQK